MTTPKTIAITYSQLEQILLSLGFRKTVIEDKNFMPQKRVAYSHDATKGLAVVGLRPTKNIVPDYTLYGVRHDLEVYGIIEGVAFEEMLVNAVA
jgi:hypothetical protein